MALDVHRSLSHPTNIALALLLSLTFCGCRSSVKSSLKEIICTVKRCLSLYQYTAYVNQPNYMDFSSILPSEDLTLLVDEQKYMIMHIGLILCCFVLVFMTPH